ncbi:uncharacterized protein LOC124444536 [Xenia sp. Carnegie-2017]|uniref:uncharacterized protein LOC124444536 n=1 Tax=Xenia sp. Carnegie-2017 TaxID=2897299 RepID=UPI001F047F97|nr:uncharacterized protein LOC124444536 [Xenia sp. Carnegie-2017]
MDYLDTSTRRFARLLLQNPDEIFQDVVWSWNHKKADFARKALRYETPFLIVVFIVIICALMVQISGFFVLSRKKTKTVASPKNVVESDAKGSCNLCHNLILAILAAGLVVTDVFLLLWNNKMSRNLPRARTTLMSSIRVLHDFQNDTVKELDRILRNDFDETVKDRLHQFRVSSNCQSRSFEQKIISAFLYKNSQSTLSELRRAKDQIFKINETMSRLLLLVRNDLKEKRSETNEPKDAKPLCSIADDVCLTSVNKEEETRLRRHVSKITETLSNINRVLKHFSIVMMIMKTRKHAEESLCKERSRKMQDLKKLYEGVEYTWKFALHTLSAYSNQARNYVVYYSGASRGTQNKL